MCFNFFMVSNTSDDSSGNALGHVTNTEKMERLSQANYFVGVFSLI